MAAAAEVIDLGEVRRERVSRALAGARNGDADVALRADVGSRVDR